MESTLRLEDKETWELNIPADLTPPRNGKSRAAEQKKATEMFKKLSEEVLGDPTSTRYSSSGDGFLDDVQHDYTMDPLFSSWSSVPARNSTAYRKPSQSVTRTRAASPCVTRSVGTAAKRPTLPVQFSAEELNELLKNGPLGSKATVVSHQILQQPTVARKGKTKANEQRTIPEAGKPATRQLISIPLTTNGRSLFLSADGKLYPIVIDNQKPGTVVQLPTVVQPKATGAGSHPVTSSSVLNAESLPAGLQIVTVPSAANVQRKPGPVTVSIPLSVASSNSAVTSRATLRLPIVNARKIPMSGVVGSSNYRPASLVPGVVEKSSALVAASIGEEVSSSAQSQQGLVIRSGSQVIPLPTNFVMTTTTSSSAAEVPSKVVRIDNVQPGVLRKLQASGERLPTLAELGPGARIIGQVSHQAMEAHLKSMTGLMKAEAVKTVAFPLMSYTPGVEQACPVRGNMNGVPVSQLIPVTSTTMASVTRMSTATHVTKAPTALPNGRTRHGPMIKKTYIPMNIKRVDRAEPRPKPGVEKQVQPASKKPLATLKLGLVEGKGVVVVPNEEGAEPRLLESKSVGTATESGVKEKQKAVASPGDRFEPHSPTATVPVANAPPAMYQANLNVASPPAAVPDAPTPAPSPGYDQDFYLDPSDAIDALLKDEAIQDLINYSTVGNGHGEHAFSADFLEEIINMDPSSLGLSEGSSEPAFDTNFLPEVETSYEGSLVGHRFEAVASPQKSSTPGPGEPSMDIKEFIGSFLSSADMAAMDYVEGPVGFDLSESCDAVSENTQGQKRAAGEVDASEAEPPRQIRQSVGITTPGGKSAPTSWTTPVGLSNWTSQARAAFVNSLVRSTFMPEAHSGRLALSKEVRQNIARRLMQTTGEASPKNPPCSHAPFLGLVGLGLASSENGIILTEEEEYEALCSKFRDVVGRLSWVWDTNRAGNSDMEKFRSGDIQLKASDLEIGPMLGKGANAAVHAAAWVNHDRLFGSDATENDAPPASKRVRRGSTYETPLSSLVSCDGQKERRENASAYPLAVKIMFNYDVMSDAGLIMREMRKELVPCLSVCLQGNFAKDSWLRVAGRLPPHPNVALCFQAFVDVISSLPGSVENYGAALPQRLYSAGLGRNMSLFLVMKRYDVTLEKYLTVAGDRLSMRARESILTQILEGVTHLVSHKIAHRDLKTDNILVNFDDDEFRRPHVVISDFGCCLDDPSLNLKLPFITEDTSRGGNSALMAPEVINAVPGLLTRIDYSKADVWATGAVAYEVFGNANPFYGDERLYSGSYRREDLPPLRNVTEDAWQRLVAALLAVDPREIMGWILNVTAKVIWEAREGDLDSETNARLEYQLATTFLSRMDFSEIKAAVEFICRA